MLYFLLAVETVLLILVIKVSFIIIQFFIIILVQRIKVLNCTLLPGWRGGGITALANPVAF